MKDFVIVHLLDKYEIGKPFSIWGFHMTLMQWFEAPSVDEIVDILNPIISVSPSLKLDTGGLVPHGAKRSAHTIPITPELRKLHEDIHEVICQKSWTIRGRYAGSLFSPHISTKSGREFSHDNFVLDKLQIVESLPQGYRKVVAEMPLGVS